MLWVGVDKLTAHGKLENSRNVWCEYVLHDQHRVENFSGLALRGSRGSTVRICVGVSHDFDWIGKYGTSQPLFFIKVRGAHFQVLCQYKHDIFLKLISFSLDVLCNFFLNVIGNNYTLTLYSYTRDFGLHAHCVVVHWKIGAGARG